MFCLKKKLLQQEYPHSSLITTTWATTRKHKEEVPAEDVCKQKDLLNPSMAYGTRWFNAAFTRDLQQSLSWTELTQLFVLIPFSLRLLQPNRINLYFRLEEVENKTAKFMDAWSYNCGINSMEGLNVCKKLVFSINNIDLLLLLLLLILII